MAVEKRNIESTGPDFGFLESFGYVVCSVEVALRAAKSQSVLKASFLDISSDGLEFVDLETLSLGYAQRILPRALPFALLPAVRYGWTRCPLHAKRPYLSFPA